MSDTNSVGNTSVMIDVRVSYTDGAELKVHETKVELANFASFMLDTIQHGHLISSGPNKALLIAPHRIHEIEAENLSGIQDQAASI